MDGVDWPAGGGAVRVPFIGTSIFGDAVNFELVQRERWLASVMHYGVHHFGLETNLSFKRWAPFQILWLARIRWRIYIVMARLVEYSSIGRLALALPRCLPQCDLLGPFRPKRFATPGLFYDPKESRIVAPIPA